LDRTARLWEIPSGRPISPKIAHQGEIRAVAFSPHEELFATCQNDGLVKVWRFPRHDPDDIQHALGWYDAFLQQSADGRFIIPSGWNLKRTSRTLRVFDSTTGRQTGEPIEASGLLNAAAISPTGDIVMGLTSRLTDPDEANAGMAKRMVRDPGLIELWDRATGTLSTKPLETPTEPIAGAFHPTRPLAAILCAGGHLMWINTESGQMDRCSHYEGEFRPRFLIRGYLRFAPNGESLATWGLGKTAVLWDVATGEPRFSIETSKTYSCCNDVTFSSSGSLMVVSGSDKRIQIVKTETGDDEVPPLIQPDWVFTSSFSADEKLLLTAGRDKIARIWDWRAGTLAAPELEHDDEVIDARLCYDLDCVITACQDGSIRFWDWHDGRPLAPPRMITGRAYCVLLSPDGRRAFVSGRNENVYVLSLSKLFVTQSMDAMSQRRLGELIAGRRQLDNGGGATLTSAEWQERWNSVRSDGSLQKIVDLKIIAKP
jgi:WD40 repeat protein